MQKRTDACSVTKEYQMNDHHAQVATGQNTKEIKIAYIGGGSKHWARTIMQDLAASQHLCGELALYDINQASADANGVLGQQIFSLPEAVADFRVTTSSDRATVLKNADFVFVSILPGPMPCFANDLDIPAEYGITQTVGDTVGPGGLSRCMRSVPMFIDIAHAVAEHAPQAWVINYTNPMTVLTQIMQQVEPDLRVIGCCHEVFGTRGWIGMMAAEYFDIPISHRNDLEIEVVGLNHFTFFNHARYHGHEVAPAIQAWIDGQSGFWSDRTKDALAREDKGRFGSCDGLIQLDFWRQFGVIGAAGDRHLVEFVPWYAKNHDRLRRWGVSVTGSEQRLRGWQPDNVAHTPPEVTQLKRSNEEAVDLVEALAGVKDMVTNINITNQGQISWLPKGHVVETLASVSYDRIVPHTTGAFPDALKIQLQHIAGMQDLTLQAATKGDRELALQALLMDPLCDIETDQAREMLDKLLDANNTLLPAAWQS
jgi:alpha-galactosidase